MGETVEDISHLEGVKKKPRLPFGAKLQYAYLLRVPILIGGILVALPIVSLFTSFRQLLGNLFVLDCWNIFWTMIATVMLAWSIAVVFRVVLLNGLERFGIPQAIAEDTVSWRVVVLTDSLTVPMGLAIVFSNGQVDGWTPFLARAGAGLAGVFAAHLLGFAALLLAVLGAPRYTAVENRFPTPVPGMRTLLERAYNQSLVSDKVRDKLGAWGKKLPGAFRAGYLDPKGMLYPGQWLTFMSMAVSFALYWLIGFMKQTRLGEEFSVPALAYVILLLILVDWFLSIAAFFLDRYRVPLLVPIIFLAVAGAQWSRSDHFYAVQRGVAVNPVSPAAVLTAPARLAPDALHPRGRVVVIATAGGGIQAAAWTAQVLTGLQKEIHQRSAAPPVNFANSIAMISSVSGGAVGTLFFVNKYQIDYKENGFTTADEDLPGVMEMAEKPALDDIAWALVYADFWRIFFPYAKLSTEDKLIDRGWALEERWRNSGNIQANLSNWRVGVEQGWRPAVIFNATLVETGEPFLLATSDVPRREVAGLGRRTFADLCPDSDLPLVTAVRLAATFPFVTPAARAVSSKPEYHVVDGGYYDNFGVDSLLNWLEDALASTLPEKRPDILIVQIRSFPSAVTAKATNRGWFYQLLAPLDALINVRSAAQLVRDRDYLSHFVTRWKPEGVHFKLATFEFQGENAPLSWRMNQSQMKDIESQWRDRVSGPNNQDFLEVSCFFRPDGKDCAKLTEKKGPW